MSRAKRISFTMQEYWTDFVVKFWGTRTILNNFSMDEIGTERWEQDARENSKVARFV